VKDAVEAYNKGLKRSPKNVLLLVKRGWALDGLNQRDRALADFTLAAQVDPENAEAHTGLGYIRAVQKEAAAAQQSADLALLHGSDRYMILHNVACIYATLAEMGGEQARANQDVALALLRRAVKLGARVESGPSEIDLMKGESAFRSLREREEFKELLRGESGKSDKPK
jgi:Flp pilus assembly protein TadD